MAPLKLCTESSRCRQDQDPDPDPILQSCGKWKIQKIASLTSEDLWVLSLSMSTSVPPSPLIEIKNFPTDVTSVRHASGHVFLAQPLFGPLLFTNNASDARDHCANERTFLSWLKLSIYMSVVSVAILVTFHLKQQPTAIEKRMATPLGVIFWLAAVASLGNGFANYITTISKYQKRDALVQSGWKTKIVRPSITGHAARVTWPAYILLLIYWLQVFVLVATAIIAACILFLSIEANTR